MPASDLNRQMLRPITDPEQLDSVACGVPLPLYASSSVRRSRVLRFLFVPARRYL
jgi:hypothetical protein